MPTSRVWGRRSMRAKWPSFVIRASSTCASLTALLGPQVAFERHLHEPKFKEAGVPFDVIPMQWYGMVRGDLVMQMALDMIAEAKGE